MTLAVYHVETPSSPDTRYVKPAVAWSIAYVNARSPVRVISTFCVCVVVMRICNSAGGATGLFRNRGAKFAVISSGSPSARIVSPGMTVTVANPAGNCVFHGVSRM